MGLLIAIWYLINVQNIRRRVFGEDIAVTRLFSQSKIRVIFTQRDFSKVVLLIVIIFLRKRKANLLTMRSHQTVESAIFYFTKLEFYRLQ